MMTTVQNHIKELLFEQDCVVIPDFGGFVTNFDGAKINSNNTFITPPQKWLAFNALLKNDDGLLSNYISKHENITHSQATSMIKLFVEGAKRQLNSDKIYSIEDLGAFSENQEGKIQFQPEISNNFYSESYGMENVFLKKPKSIQHELQVISIPNIVSKGTIQQVFVKDNRQPMAEFVEDEEGFTYKRKRFSKVLPYIYAVVGSAVLASAVYLYDNNKKVNFSSLSPFQSNNITQTKAFVVEEPHTTVIANVTEDAKPKPIDQVKIETSPEIRNTINEIDNRFFVITGSFGNKRNAKKLLAILKSRGFEDAEIIYPKRKEKLIKVSAGGFGNEVDADQGAVEVTNTINLATWIYKN